MARVDTLGHFLTDVADAIRTKGGTSENIQASSFDTAIANLPSGGGITDYVVADYAEFTLTASNWNENIYELILSTNSYTIGSNLQIGIPLDSSTANTLNIANAGLTILEVTTSGTNKTIVISAINLPSVDLNVIIFGITEVSQGE